MGRNSVRPLADRQKACAAYKAGANVNQAGALVGVTGKTVLNWLKAEGIKPRGNGNRDHGLIDLRELSGGECLRLGGKCSFKSCRHRLKRGDCSIKLSCGVERDDGEIAALLGVTRQGVNFALHRCLTKLRIPAKDLR